MSSAKGNEFVNTLNGMIKDLSNHKRDRYSLMEFYINDRLSKSLDVYYKELYDSLSYLSKKEGIRILKEYNKMRDS